MKRLLLLAVVLLASCKQGNGSVEIAPLTPTGKLLRDLSVYALGHPLAPDELKEKEAAVTSGKLDVDKYIDDLLQQPMGGRLAKDLVLGAASPLKDRHPVPIHSVLRSFKEDDVKIYYTREKCAKSEAKSVKPWWDPEHEVLVCPSAYRPEVKGDKAGRTCGAEVCGCGPMLMDCTESKDHYQKTQERVQQEVIETASYVVDGNLPIEKLFTMNETVRNNDAELLYRRARVAAGEDPSLLVVTGYGDFKGKLKERVEQIPGQAAGILSSPALTYSSDALRGVMRNYYDYLWCTGVQSSRVSTQAVLGLDIVDLRVGDGWKKLASMNICTDCHARLDYGMQFFWGYPSSTMGIDFRPSLARTGQGPLYGRNIKDERGVADLTPAGFANIATSQPEFGDCMTRRVVDHVFGGTNSGKDYAAVRETFDKTHQIKAMLRTAMVRFAKRKPSELPVAASTTTATPAATLAATDAAVDGDKIALTPALMKMIKKDCKECHGKDDEVNLLVDSLDRKTLATMIDKVGFGAMPKNTEGLEDRERRAFVTEVASLLFTGSDRDTVTSYFADNMRPQPVHRFTSAMQSVTASAALDRKDNDKDKPLKSFRPSSVESSIPQSQLVYSPGVAVSSGVSALRTCKEIGLTGAALRGCVERASSPDNVVTGVLGD